MIEDALPFVPAAVVVFVEVEVPILIAALELAEAAVDILHRVSATRAVERGVLELGDGIRLAFRAARVVVRLALEFDLAERGRDRGEVRATSLRVSLAISLRVSPVIRVIISTGDEEDGRDQEREHSKQHRYLSFDKDGFSEAPYPPSALAHVLAAGARDTSSHEVRAEGATLMSEYWSLNMRRQASAPRPARERDQEPAGAFT